MGKIKGGIMDKYKCERCGIIFDEFEMNYAEACIDKKELCRKCRKILKESENKTDNKFEIIREAGMMVKELKESGVIKDE